MSENIEVLSENNQHMLIVFLGWTQDFKYSKYNTKTHSVQHGQVDEKGSTVHRDKPRGQLCS